MISIPVTLLVGGGLYYYWKHRQGHTQSIVFGLIFGILIGATAFGSQVRTWTQQGVTSTVNSVSSAANGLQKK